MRLFGAIASEDDVCVFDDVTTAHDDTKRKCIVHGGNCESCRQFVPVLTL